MHNFKNLIIWKKSIDLSLEIYNTTKLFPDSEKYGLVSQLRRSSISVASNIAEGSGRKSDKEFIQFLHISIGSICEVETQLIIANKLNFVDDFTLNQFSILISDLRKMINGFIKNLKAKLLK